MKMIDNIMTIPLIMMAFAMAFFFYRKVRIDLFRDSVFKTRRALFLIAAEDPDAFFKDNTYYRFFETILNATLSYTDNFSLFSLYLDKKLRKGYSKRANIELFDYSRMKENYLKKVKSDKIRKEVSDLMDKFMFQYAFFLCTRTFIDLTFFSLTTTVGVIVLFFKAFFVREHPLSKESTLFKDSISPAAKKMMNNSQFANATSRLYA